VAYWQEIKDLKSEAKLGGGHNKMSKLKMLGKLSARERINYLTDKNSVQFEIGSLAAYGHYQQFGGCPAAGVIVVLGKINERLCIIVANDSTVKAGAWFPMTTKKNLRAQEIAMANRIPIIYLVDSAGIFLPLQNEVFADKDHFGRIFRNNAIMSSMGVVQISAIMGPCVAGGAYLPVMSDEIIIVEKTASIFLAGSHLVKAAIGEQIDNETLGGAQTHTSISGVADHRAKDDIHALQIIRDLIEKIPEPALVGFKRIEAKNPLKNYSKIADTVPENSWEPYDSYSLLQHLVDADSFDEYKSEYGKTLITAFARIEGWSVGIVANQRSKKINQNGEIQLGGVIYSKSADKATRFIANCNQRSIPIVFLQDVMGFMVGKRAEHGGIIKDGAKMVNAVANSVVPKFTIVIGNSYGAGNYAMCGRAFDPRFILAWPGAQIGVMGKDQASKVLFDLQKKSQSNNTNNGLLDIEKIKSEYQKQESSVFAASKMWVDEIINPAETRKWISMGIEMANHNPVSKKFNMGILQV